MAVSQARSATEDAFLDAAERLLVDVGHAGISTRRLAEEAGSNHGLVHYYFGSMDNLFARVLERFTERLVERQREMYSADVPFIEKWRTAMGFIDEDIAAGYPKVWFELEALAWNKPELRDRLVHVNDEWRSVLTEAFDGAMAEYGLDRERFPLEAMVSLVMTFNLGLMWERLSGIDTGHRELLAAIDRWVAELEEGAR